MAAEEDGFGPLPEDLLLDVFSRLSGWDMIRCKCVSKQWHQIITNVCVPQLSANAPISGIYYRVSQVSGELLWVLTDSPQDLKDRLQHHVAYCGSSHYIDCAPLNSLPEPFDNNNISVDRAHFAGMSYASVLPFEHGGPDFLDCCNGLLLFVQTPKPQFYVCNPTIRQFVSVPCPPPSVHLSSLYASLAFDPCESIHYRVVALSITTQPQCVHIFYSQSGEWMTHELQPQIQLRQPSSGKDLQLLRYSVYLKGVLYRLSLLNKVVCFDLNRLKTCVINCPNKISSPQPGCIGVSDGLLSYVKREEGYVWVWRLDSDNPRESNEWSLKYKICFTEIVYCVAKKRFSSAFVWLHPIGIHPTKDILFVGSSSGILMYHIGSGHIIKDLRTFTLTGDVSCGYFFPVFMHRNTFVTLKNWCRGTTTEINNCEEVDDEWCYIENNDYLAHEAWSMAHGAPESCIFNL